MSGERQGREPASRRRELSRRLRALREAPDAGSAVVEFLGIGLVLLVPLVYLVLVLAELQAATFAAEAAAREAGRILATDPSAHERAAAAVELALADQGVDAVAAEALSITCGGGGCSEPGERIGVEVAVAVPLPMVPAFLRDSVPAQVPVSATHVAVVDRFLEVP